MTFLFLALIGFLYDFVLKRFILCPFLTRLVPFCIGSKINDQQRSLLTQALRSGDGASSSHCSTPGATDE